MLWLGLFNMFSGVVLMIWCQTTNSMGLSAYTLLTLLDVLNLLTSVLNFWFDRKKTDASYTFGYEQFGVLAVFASTILIQLCCMIIVKESIERFIQQPEIHTGRFLPGILLVFVCHLVIMYGIDNPPLAHVAAASSSSWLQEHVAEVSQTLCHFLPGLSGLLLPRVNPFLLLGWAGAGILWLTHYLIEHHEYYMADTFASLTIAVMVTVTIYPMSIFSGRVLLQTTPPHVIGQLDKCLREASTLDGVLEFRNEHFWTQTFGKLAGSIHVRIGRDANEQLVLAHLVDRLSNLVPDLTVQVFKDEWSWHTSTMSLLQESALRFPSSSATYSSPRNSVSVPLPLSMQSFKITTTTAKT